MQEESKNPSAPSPELWDFSSPSIETASPQPDAQAVAHASNGSHAPAAGTISDLDAKTLEDALTLAKGMGFPIDKLPGADDPTKAAKNVVAGIDPTILAKAEAMATKTIPIETAADDAENADKSPEQASSSKDENTRSLGSEPEEGSDERMPAESGLSIVARIGWFLVGFLLLAPGPILAMLIAPPATGKRDRQAAIWSTVGFILGLAFCVLAALAIQERLSSSIAYAAQEAATIRYGV